MAHDLADKVAVVTGGASGLGGATVERFVAEGAQVVIGDVDEERGRALAAECGGNARFERVDVADEEQMSRLVAVAVETFGALNVMVNNAGISSAMHKSFLHDDLADFDRVMSVNVLGVMLGTREAARHMADNGGGSIVNLSSIGGTQAGGGVMTYRASKAAILHFSKSVALELAPYDIRVNCLAPGNIPTPILASSIKGMDEETSARFVEATRERMRSDRPLERDGTPEDVAEAVVYLASYRARYVTGTVLPIDGGTSAGKPVRRRPKSDTTTQ